MAAVAKALGDPVRLQLVDVLRKHAGKVCVCELVPLFDLSQPTVSHHLKVLRDAGIVGVRAAGAVGLLLRDPRHVEGAFRMAEMTEIRDSVRARYAAAAKAAAPRELCGCGSGARVDVLRHRGRAHRRAGTRCSAALSTRTPSRRGARHGGAGLPRLWRADRRRRPPRGRDGARPRFRRRRGRADLRPARRADAARRSGST